MILFNGNNYATIASTLYACMHAYINDYVMRIHAGIGIIIIIHK